MDVEFSVVSEQNTPGNHGRCQAKDAQSAPRHSSYGEKAVYQVIQRERGLKSQFSTP